MRIFIILMLLVFVGCYESPLGPVIDEKVVDTTAEVETKDESMFAEFVGVWYNHEIGIWMTIGDSLRWFFDSPRKVFIPVTDSTWDQVDVEWLWSRHFSKKEKTIDGIQYITFANYWLDVDNRYINDLGYYGLRMITDNEIEFVEIGCTEAFYGDCRNQINNTIRFKKLTR